MPLRSQLLNLVVASGVLLGIVALLILPPSDASSEPAIAPSPKVLGRTALAERGAGHQTNSPPSVRLPAQAEVHRSEDETQSPIRVLVQSPGLAAVDFELIDSKSETTRPPVYSGKTDASGRALVELAPGAVDHSRFQITLWARAVESGLQQQLSRVRWSRADESWRVRLKMREGGTLRGRVWDSAGHGVRAQIRLRSARGNGGSRDGIKLAESADDGHFEGHFNSPMQGDLIAVSRELGTGTIRDVRLGPNAPPREFEIQVDSGGSIRGQVVDLQGHPVPGLGLSASMQKAAPGEAEGGNEKWSGATDSNGQFEMLGLRSGHYEINALSAERTPRGLLTEEPVPADGTERKLTYGGSRLIVALYDASGRPWDRPVTQPRAPFRRNRFDWPRIPWLVVRSIDAPASEIMRPTEIGEGRFVFEVVPDRAYAVAAFGGAFTGPCRRISLEAEARPQEIELHAREQVTLSELNVFIANPHAESPDSSKDPTELTVEDPETGAVIARHRQPGGFEVPPGRYRIVARGYSPAIGKLLRAEEIVELRAQSIQSVSLSLAPKEPLPRSTDDATSPTVGLGVPHFRR